MRAHAGDLITTGVTPLRSLFVGAAALLLSLGCDDTSSSSGGSAAKGGATQAGSGGAPRGPLGEQPGAEQGCLDTIEAIARAGERCFGDYDAQYAATIKSVGGDCKNVISLRDETSLRSTCIPSLKTVGCGELKAGKIDPTCADQLQVKASTDTGSGGGSGASPLQACLDMVEALAKAAERCGQPYQQSYDEAVQAIANGDCKNIIQVRDEASLRSTCIPSLAQVTCSQLQTGMLDASCKSQLFRPAGAAPEGGAFGVSGVSE